MTAKDSPHTWTLVPVRPRARKLPSLDLALIIYHTGSRTHFSFQHLSLHSMDCPLPLFIARGMLETLGDPARFIWRPRFHALPALPLFSVVRENTVASTHLSLPCQDSQLLVSPSLLKERTLLSCTQSIMVTFRSGLLSAIFTHLNPSIFLVLQCFL